MANHLNIRTRRQFGQAMTEFNVTAAFLLVPLFIMIPLLGKYIDMKHASVQAARYMAWERTVWFETTTAPKVKFDPSATINARIKNQNILESETRKRFFSAVNIDELAGSETLNPLWNDRGNNIVKNQDNVKLEFLNGGNEPVLKKGGNGNSRSIFYTAIESFSEIVGNVASVIDTALNAAKLAWNAVAGALSPIPFPTFNNVSALFPDVMAKYNFNGYYRSKVTLDIDNALFNRVFDPTGEGNLGSSLNFESHAAVLTDSWVVAGDKQFAAYTKTFVPFAPLQEFWEPVQSIVTWKDPIFGLSIAPEMAGLELGYVDTSPITDSSVKASCSKGGLCSYE